MGKLILSVLGQDRPGIIAAISGILAGENCNIENVSQTTLQSEFAGIFVASAPSDLSAAALQQRLQQTLAPQNLHVHVKALASREDGPPQVPVEPFVITTKGPDRKGLVAGITAVIARYGANVTNLQAVFKGGSLPGDNIMIYEVEVPTSIDQRALHQELRNTAAGFDLEISIQHRHIFEAINRI